MASSENQDQEAPAVVAIGASAGGIEALQEFFSALSADLGLAYVVIMHLAPDRESGLPEILARCTKMKVRQLVDHEKAKLSPDCIYVIAPDRKLEVTDGSIGASRFEQPRGQRSAIDVFFRSLAKRHGEGFAIVLSGSGSDGAMGAKAVKESGGLVLVQDPNEAGHEGMPRAVIATGIADVVLPVRELAERLALFARSKSKVVPLIRKVDHGAAVDETEEKAFRGIFDLLRKRTGHDFAKYKRGTVLRRLSRRMQLSGRAYLPDYLDYVTENVEEIQALFEDLLISVTTFFRDSEAWEALREQVIVPLIDRAGHDVPIRVWVPGCATGEEAYSLAILFQEELDRRQTDCTITIFASDLDEGALSSAREGVYTDAIVADVSEARLKQYFRSQEHSYRVSSTIRDRVVFASHSLLRDPPFSQLHLISCRNLLIYLNKELQEQVMGLFQYACRPEGYLYLGVSESADNDGFRTVDKKHRIFQVKKSPEDGRAPLPTLLAVPRGILRQEHEPAPRARQAAEMHLEALEAVAPPSLLVDRQWNVAHLSNSAARYLQQRGGTIARQVTDVVRSDLRDAVQVLLHRAFEDSAQQVTQFAAVGFNGTQKTVAMVAQRHRWTDRDSEHVLITFVEMGEASAEQVSTDSERGPDVDLREKLRQAELRGERMRDDFHLANEDLRAANEELQSLNEEYRSTTEELETSKEELQSINEELQTVNQELKSKVDDLSRSNDDLENLMTATSIPILFLDRELHIKRYTPGVADLVNITSHDRGRPIGNFTHRLQYGKLLDDARSVLERGDPIETKAVTDDDRVFIVRISPYVTAGNGNDGIVITFIDVSTLKRAEQKLRESEEEFRALVEASAQIVWRADAHGRMNDDSPSWRSYTGQTVEQWRTSWLEAVHPKERPKVEQAWQDAVHKGVQLSMEFRVCHASSQIYRWTAVHAVPLRRGDDTVRGWVGMHTDIQDSWEAQAALREADRRKDDFLAMLGHELRNPLAAIRSSISVLQTAPSEGGISSRAWAIIDRQSGHMTRLIDDLLDIVRMDRGKLRLERRSLSLSDCIGEVVQAFGTRIDAAKLELRIDLPDDPLYVNADPERLVQVLDNLFRNAVTNSDEGGRITICARRKDEDAVITLRDTGIGMEASQIETLFEPYRQVDGGRGSGGLGLGLAMVKEIVKLHGGTVAARSDGLGAGSEFQFTIPIAADQPVRDTVSPGPSPRHILVVDDETDVADMFGAMLETLGQQVAVAYSGEQALEAVRRQAPEIAFLDLSMPGMTGIELARRLREELKSDTPCLVALSGRQVDSTIEMQVFDHQLLKPAPIEAIAKLLNSLSS